MYLITVDFPSTIVSRHSLVGEVCWIMSNPNSDILKAMKYKKIFPRQHQEISGKIRKAIKNFNENFSKIYHLESTLNGRSRYSYIKLTQHRWCGNHRSRVGNV